MKAIKFRKVSSLKNCFQVHDYYVPGLFVRIYRSSTSGVYYLACFSYRSNIIHAFCACGSHDVPVSSIIRSFFIFQSCHVL